MQVRALPRAMS